MYTPVIVLLMAARMDSLNSALRRKRTPFARNHQGNNQDVDLRAGKNKGVSVRLEQREEESGARKTR
ncbi:Uncharacterised protein [Enterobacter asburiae]|uniref:Uncharacterized protein n=1 Tax=Enterobacter asburiae TaxID=61645 RepID=A0A376FMP1_ENTAS|nr:Uncharacterised protein [Enterobacter asburiae]